ncbi:hypothetical protein [Vibrio harveyi]|uniref:hypothetical protein n=1 Tax=Vibrio harveyi TaxID=669 RepID=UPI0011439B5B|nr:hypothetical protein [Vibrio harveyi]
MNKKNLFELYEKIYFHEMEIREKLVGRVQVNFALLATGYAVLSYMIRMVDYSQPSVVIDWFYAAVLACVCCSFFCINHLIRAFWGNVYRCMPTACEIDEYKTELKNHNLQIEEYNLANPDNIQPKNKVNKCVEKYIYEQVRDCTSHNTTINDQRSAHIHHSFRWILFCSVPFIFSSLIFISGDLDVSSPTKETLIRNTSQLEELQRLTVALGNLERSICKPTDKEIIVSKRTPPPPPPPPKAPEPRNVIQHDVPAKAENKNE